MKSDKLHVLMCCDLLKGSKKRAEKRIEGQTEPSNSCECLFLIENLAGSS